MPSLAKDTVPAGRSSGSGCPRVELSKAEYLRTANLPQIAYLEKAHVRTLAAGLAALAKTHLEADGLCSEAEQ